MSGEAWQSLEDAESIPSAMPVQDAVLLDADLDPVLLPGGDLEVRWGVRSMDCADCAMKATRAIDRLPNVKTAKVSATDGSVTIGLDLEQGPLHRVNSVLTAIGFPPDSEEMVINAPGYEAAQHRFGGPRGLARTLRSQPGILDAWVEANGQVLIQLPSTDAPELAAARDDALGRLFGRSYQLAPMSSARLRPDQWRLIGAATAIPMLLVLAVLGWTEPGLLETIPVQIFAAVAVAIGGFQMAREALASVIHRPMNFQVLTTLATIGAAILGEWTEALLVVTLVAVAKHMEQEAMNQARAAMQGGLDRLPAQARRVNRIQTTGLGAISVAAVAPTGPAAVPKVGGTEIVSTALLLKGDHIEVRSGELIPADGILLRGKGTIDRSPLTGESIPIDLVEGEFVEAGLVLTKGPVTLNVEATGDATRLAGLMDAAATYRDRPPRIHSAIERFTAMWIPSVLVGAVLLGFLVMLGTIPTDAEILWLAGMKVTLLLWVVACPCALLLAAPMPHAAALSILASNGAIARRGDIIERAGSIDLALLDKTGTLTAGKPRLTEIITPPRQSEDVALRLAAGLEQSSNHPYAVAILERLESSSLSPIRITSIEDIDGGVIGTASGRSVGILRADATLADPTFLRHASIDAAWEGIRPTGDGASVVVRDSKVIALLRFMHDDVHDTVPEMIAACAAMNIPVEILSGDHPDAVRAFAERVGLDVNMAHGGLTPEQKVGIVQQRSEERKPMMVGDGFNDAAALAASDLGVAIGSGEKVNIEAADVLVPADDPIIVTELLRVARKCQQVVNQNLIISVGVTAILVASVLLGANEALWINVLIHELSALVVIFNGLQITSASNLTTIIGRILKSLWEETAIAIRLLLSRYLPTTGDIGRMEVGVA